MGEPFKALGIAEIQGLNKTVIDKFGGMYVEGDGNFHNRGSLEHILEATLFPSFGEELYPTIYGKIAAISQVIITRMSSMTATKGQRWLSLRHWGV